MELELNWVKILNLLGFWKLLHGYCKFSVLRKKKKITYIVKLLKYFFFIIYVHKK